MPPGVAITTAGWALTTRSSAQADEGDATAARRVDLAAAEEHRERGASAAQVGLTLSLHQLTQHQPFRRRRGHVADQLGEGAVESRRDLLQDEDRRVADAVLQVGEVALGHARRQRDALARQAAAGAQQADALAEGDEKRVLDDGHLLRLRGLGGGAADRLRGHGAL